LTCANISVAISMSVVGDASDIQASKLSGQLAKPGARGASPKYEAELKIGARETGGCESDALS
jgi:hypothetical protein